MGKGRYSLIALAALVACIVLLLTACTQKIAVPREGRILKGTPEQEIVQCQRQPNFPGCEHVAR